MPFLTIAAITVPVAEASEEEPVRIGSESMAYAGNTLSDVQDERRAWSVTTRLLVAADAATLRTAIANGAFVTVNGDLVENVATTCTVAVKGTSFVKVASIGYRIALSLLIRETGT